MPWGPGCSSPGTRRGARRSESRQETQGVLPTAPRAAGHWAPPGVLQARQGSGVCFRLEALQPCPESGQGQIRHRVAPPSPSSPSPGDWMKDEIRRQTWVPQGGWGPAAWRQVCLLSPASQPAASGQGIVGRAHLLCVGDILLIAGRRGHGCVLGCPRRRSLQPANSTGNEEREALHRSC